MILNLWVLLFYIFSGAIKERIKEKVVANFAHFRIKYMHHNSM